MERYTRVEVDGEQFRINGRVTYPNRVWMGCKIEGLLMNARLVQGIFDDLNPETRGLWAYPDTQIWDPERNTAEFLAAMPEWVHHGLLAFTLNLQGGSPQGYSKDQPWHNSAFTPDGDLRPAYTARLERILDEADRLGMVVILGLFYFGQAYRLRGEIEILRAVDQTVEWLFSHGYQNVLIEIANECDIVYRHAILQPERAHELIERIQSQRQDGRRLLVSTSFSGCKLPTPNVLKQADFVLLHGNGATHPGVISAMLRELRAMPAYRPQPVLFNEDDHFDFDQPQNNLVSALSEYASWGYFDYRMQAEAHVDGYQSVPVDWGIHSARKKSFFSKLKEITQP